MPSQAKIDQAELIKIIGARMREARSLCNLSQELAAKRLGYANSSKLAKVEKASDTQSVPLWLIFRAAKIYEVSVDFLFGFTDDWEAGARMTQEREVSGWLFEAWGRLRSRDMQALAFLHKRVEFINEAVASFIKASHEAQAALDRFSEVNPEFQDMPAGASLVAKVGRAMEAAQGAKAKMKRFRIECQLANGGGGQMPLFEEGANAEKFF